MVDNDTEGPTSVSIHEKLVPFLRIEAKSLLVKSKVLQYHWIIPERLVEMQGQSF